MCKKFSKKEIETLMQHIPKQIIIHANTEYERFKQIKIDNEYAPYFISSCGRLFSINNNCAKKYNELRELRLRKRKDGYIEIRLTYNNKNYNFLLHILVANAFVNNENPNKFIIVNHLDGDKGNNMYLNLEWTDYSGNAIHALKTGLFKHAKGEQVGSSKYTKGEVIEVCELLKQNISIKDIVSHTRLTYAAVTNILYKRTWLHITCNYDFSNYSYGKDIDLINGNIHKLCMLASSNNDYTIMQLSEQTGINRRTVYDILKGKTHKNISKLYDLSKYQK